MGDSKVAFVSRCAVTVATAALLAVVGCGPKVSAGTQTPAPAACAEDAMCGDGRLCVEGCCVEDCDFEPVYFDYDESVIRPDMRPVLERMAACVLRVGRPIAIEGHVDERGNDEFNLAVSSRLAESVRRTLGGLGVPKAQMRTQWMGEERPVCTEHTEACWARCRRVEISWQ